VTTDLPAAVRGQSTFRTSLASQNAPPSVTGSGDNEVEVGTVWTSPVSAGFDPAAAGVVVDLTRSPPPLVGVRLDATGYTGSNADVVGKTGGTVSSRVGFNVPPNTL